MTCTTESMQSWLVAAARSTAVSSGSVSVTGSGQPSCSSPNGGWSLNPAETMMTSAVASWVRSSSSDWSCATMSIVRAPSCRDRLTTATGSPSSASRAPAYESTKPVQPGQSSSRLNGMESPMATSTKSGSASLGACDSVAGGLPLGCVDGAPLEHAASSSVRATGRTRGTEGSGISESRAPTGPSPALPARREGSGCQSLR